MSGLKRGYIKDCKDNLRSGSGQLNKKYWQECHELWGGGSAGTEPLDFGMETLNTETEIVDEENVDREEISREEDLYVDIHDDPLVDIQNCDDIRSTSASPAPSVSSNTSHSENEAIDTFG